MDLREMKEMWSYKMTDKVKKEFACCQKAALFQVKHWCQYDFEMMFAS